ncbi:acireductone synthase [Enterobacteriaceae bacterium BIT-l23]|uniref:acireductone synthase n=1 Tax=Jejubacter sp. L23 TaxID=3092086 RepID=UPI00158550C3|nr:acireductone synthase [Enterobacteriaceae bacterium BIT-l23]
MIRAIVTDIEGTTSDIRFVHDVLFPMARQRMAEFVSQQQSREPVSSLLDDLRQEINQPEASADQLVATLEDFMAQDRKSTVLKALQGMIWRDGYLNGDFKGHVYEDVPPALMRWQAQGIALGVYSSGSVEAQKLLFGYSSAGDLSPFFSVWFDTHVGAKREADAYRTIAGQLVLAPDEILFLSDIHQELDAAQEAGWHTIQLIRGEQDPLSRHPQVQRFDQISPENMS